MQTIPILNRSGLNAYIVRITCCLELSKLKWMGVAGPLELLMLDIGRNSNFRFVILKVFCSACIALIFASCAVVLASVNCLMLGRYSPPLLSKSWSQNEQPVSELALTGLFSIFCRGPMMHTACSNVGLTSEIYA